MTQTQALTILKTGANVFLTGEPGAGKTYTINDYVQYLREHEIEVAITASTGIAATHIGGMTIHSWSGIGIKNNLSAYDLDKIASTEYVSKRIKKAKVLVIDEVSMLSPQTLSMVEAVCREVKQSHEPFGGIQVVLVGDFFQLPPIMKNIQTPVEDLFNNDGSIPRFAYDSPAWSKAKFLTCYLTDQYRQSDNDFLAVLQAIRGNSFEEWHLEQIQKRVVEPKDLPTRKAPKLFSHNVHVDRVNDEMLGKLNTESEIFQMDGQGKSALVEALKKGCLSPETLCLKVGAQVMCTKNSPREGFVNGTLGEVIAFETGTRLPVVRLRDGRRVTIEKMDWNVEENGAIKARIKQVPLRLAWAITIHKSQGMSLDEAIMDLRSVFEYGQGYVALSRVRTLDGLHLLGFNERVFQVHPDVLEKDISFRQSSVDAEDYFADMSESEVKKMQTDFILASGGNLQTVKVAKATADFAPKKKKGDTTNETLTFWQEGKDIKTIAKIRQLTTGTILSHLEKLADLGEIKNEDFARIVPEKIKKVLPIIAKAFSKTKKGGLTPVFKSLKGKYSYDELRLARLFLGKN